MISVMYFLKFSELAGNLGSENKPKGLKRVTNTKPVLNLA